MPQAGFDPPAQSEVCYQTIALPPSHHGWINSCVMDCKNVLFKRKNKVFLKFLIFIRLLCRIAFKMRRFSNQIKFSINLKFLKWQPCHSPVRVFCSSRGFNHGFSLCSTLRQASFPIPYFKLF